MANIFEQLISGRIKEFKNDFCDEARSLFFDEKSHKLIHPGEFGSYRERITRQFLSYFLPSRFSMNDGFILNSSGEVSTQCDIVIYDSEETPAIKTDQLQRFYPIETVYAVGEVKSVLTLVEFEKALQKLMNIKKMRFKTKLKFPTKPSNIKHEELDLENCEHHNIVSFLVCQKLAFDPLELNGKFNYIYNNLNTVPFRHNIILSIEDGLLSYSTRWQEMVDPESDDTPPDTPYPFPRRKFIDCTNKFNPATADLKHISIFLSELSWCLNTTAVFEFNVLSYMESMRDIPEIPLKMYFL